MMLCWATCIYTRNVLMWNKKSTSRQITRVPLSSLTECYKPATLISRPSFSFFSTVYGTLIRKSQTGNFLSYNLSTKDTARTKQTQHPTEAYTSITPSLNSLKTSSLRDWHHTLNSSTLSQTPNWHKSWHGKNILFLPSSTITTHCRETHIHNLRWLLHCLPLRPSWRALLHPTQKWHPNNI